MPATITRAFIPRILGNVTISQIRETFSTKQLGKVKTIDIHRRKNEKNNHYSFAFLELVLYDSREANALCEDILDIGFAKVFYDKKNYWEVKAFLPRSKRVSIAQKETFMEEEIAEEIPDICDTLRTPTLDTRQILCKTQMQEELIRKASNRDAEKPVCCNCGSNSSSQYDRTMFWKNYTFCTLWCQYDVEYDIRTRWLQTRKRNPTIMIPAEPIVGIEIDKYSECETSGIDPPVFYLEMDDDDIQPQSKFIPMFERIRVEQEEDDEDQRTQSIWSMCKELTKRPTVFTNEDLKEMEKDYEAVEMEMMMRL